MMLTNLESRVLRRAMIEQVRDLLDGSPDVSEGEYTRGMVELTVNVTLREGEDVDLVRTMIEKAILVPPERHHTTMTSTAFCDDESCKGHVTHFEIEGTVVVTDDPQRPLGVIR